MSHGTQREVILKMAVLQINSQNSFKFQRNSLESGLSPESHDVGQLEVFATRSEKNSFLFIMEDEDRSIFTLNFDEGDEKY